MRPYAELFGPNTPDGLPTGWLPEHDFYELRTAHREHMKSRKYQPKRSRNSRKCSCCYYYFYGRNEHAKKADMKVALRQDYWEDGCDVEEIERQTDFAVPDYCVDLDQEIDFPGAGMAPETHVPQLEKGDDKLHSLKSTVHQTQRAEQDLESEWDMMSNASSDDWSVVNGN